MSGKKRQRVAPDTAAAEKEKKKQAKNKPQRSPLSSPSPRARKAATAAASVAAKSTRSPARAKSPGRKVIKKEETPFSSASANGDTSFSAAAKKVMANGNKKPAAKAKGNKKEEKTKTADTTTDTPLVAQTPSRWAHMIIMILVLISSSLAGLLVKQDLDNTLHVFELEQQLAQLQASQEQHDLSAAQIETLHEQLATSQAIMKKMEKQKDGLVEEFQQRLAQMEGKATNDDGQD